MNELTKKFNTARNDINKIIITLAEEAVKDFDTYEEAIEAINKMKWELAGSLGRFVMESAKERIIESALKKATD